MAAPHRSSLVAKGLPQYDLIRGTKSDRNGQSKK